MTPLSILWVIPIILIISVIVVLSKNYEKPRIVQSVLVATVTIILIGSVLVPILNNADPKDDLDVYLIAGQSNAAYLHYSLDDVDPVPGNSTYFYGTAESPIIYGSHATATYDESFDSYSIQQYNHNLAHLESSFSSKYSQLSGKSVLTINVGVSGSFIDEWQESGFCWTYTESVINDALSKIPDNFNPVCKGVIWIQGESDNTMSESEYSSKLLNTFELFSSKGFDEFFISKVRRDVTTSGQRNPIGPSNAQISLSQTYTNIHLASQISDTFTIGNGKMKADNLHYSQLGHNELGVEIAEYCYSYFYV